MPFASVISSGERIERLDRTICGWLEEVDAEQGDALALDEGHHLGILGVLGAASLDDVARPPLLRRIR